VTNKIRRSDTTEFLNIFSIGTKREIVGMPIDFISEPQAWEAVVLPLNYARARKPRRRRITAMRGGEKPLHQRKT
jgi:hypothetical protein